MPPDSVTTAADSQSSAAQIADGSITNAKLLARRGSGGFAASPRLDAGLQFTLKTAANSVTITFALWRDGVAVPALRRMVKRVGPLAVGPYTMWLSDQEGFFSLNGLEPITSYSLHLAAIAIEPNAGPAKSWTNLGPKISKLDPLALGEETAISLASAAWHYANAAGALRVATGAQQNSGLQLAFDKNAAGAYPIYGSWSFDDAANAALNGAAGDLFRIRFRIASNLAQWTGVCGLRLRASVAGNNNATMLRLLGKTLNGALSAPGPNGEPGREYTLFVALNSASRVLPHFEVVSDGDEGTTAGAVTLQEVAVSHAPANALQWMKTIEWNFSVSPQGGGWQKDVAAANAGFIVPSFETRWTELNPINNTRRHGLRIECRNAAGHFGGWLFPNLFQFRVANQNGVIDASRGYDFRNRLLKVIVTLRCSVSGDKAPAVMFTLECNGFAHQFQVIGLHRPDGSTPAAGDEVQVSFFVAPDHNALTANLSQEAPKPIVFRYQLSCTNPGADVNAAVTMENLQVFEALIADLPAGYGYATYQDNWPQISIPENLPTPFKTINAGAPSCPVTAAPQPSRYYVNDHGLAQSNGRWHVYGILENGDTIRPMPAGARPDITPYTTIGATSFFVSGLSHVRQCDANAGLFASSGGSTLLNFSREQPPANPSQEIMVPSGPSEIWNLWAPTIISWQGKFWMFYSSNWGYDIWLASSTDADLHVANWQYLNRDGSAAVGARVAVVPNAAAQNGRDFNVVRSLSNGQQLFHGFWNGGSPCRVYHIQSTTPTGFDYTQSKVVFDLINSDSGRMAQDNESVFVLHDANTGIYYLTISKDGNLAPGFEVGVTFVLDYQLKAIMSMDAVSGDRSIIIDNNNRHDASEPLLISPVDMCSADASGAVSLIDNIGDQNIRVNANAMVLDRADGAPGAGKMVQCGLRNGRRFVFSGLGVGSGDNFVMLGRVTRAAFLSPTADSVVIRYFVSDRRDYTQANGRVYMVDGGAEKKIRNYTLPQKGMQITPATGNRSVLLDGLGDPTSLFYDQSPESDGNQYLYVACRNQNQILRVNISALPNSLPLSAQVFQSGLNNPTELADGGDRVYVMEALGPNSQVRWFMKQGGGSGVLPNDLAVPFINPTAIQFVGSLLAYGAVILYSDMGSNGQNQSIVAIRISDGKRFIICSSAVGVGPLQLPMQISQGVMWDELDDVVTKVYWSADPNHFDQNNYIASMPHHAGEWTCDTTQPGNPWYFSFTRFERKYMADGSEWLTDFGWGVQPIKWSPAIAVPVGQAPHA
ncbi:hypothetical protein BH09SUM1_BH09SUM1_09010 [soil metagenome]